MLEALLNHFRSYGMDDLEFMIVNSKLTHAQDKFHELQKRVSFPVYQETEHEEVWNLLEGGKDDMYIYDRCGRLTYFIPFPLSILNESPLVSNAILATYFQSPCGSTCDQKTVGVEEFVKNMVNGFDSSNTTEEVEYAYEVTEQYTDNNETKNDTLLSNDLFSVIDQENEFYLSNSTDMNNTTDYDYPSSNDTYHPKDNDISQLSEHNDTSVDKARVFFNSIYRLFFNNGNLNETCIDKNATLNETQNNVTSSNETIHNNGNHHPHNTHHAHKHHPRQKQAQNNKKKSDRCVEADYQVCKDWSKKRLLHAQKCCSETQSPLDNQEQVSCRNYGKKRCKKIQSILKCCIKTEYSEPTTAEPTETALQPNEAVDAVCCRNTDEGKFCRVSSTGDCEEDEERSPSETM